MNPSLSARAALLPLVLTCGLANLLAQTDVEKPADSVPLDKVPERLTQLDDEWKKKAEEVRTLVDAEEVAKRISEATAQSLRFSLRTAGNANLDTRNVASNARIPADNATLSKAFRDLDTITSRQLLERTVLVENAVKEVRDRVSKLLVEAKDQAEIEGFITTIDGLKSALSRRTISSATDFQGRLSAASSILGQLRRLVEAQASGNLTQLSQAVAEFRNNNYPDRELVLESDRRKRIDSIIKPYQKAEEESLAALEAA
ncbi:MAG TPA: hypothetical protein VM735_04395, partial [Candidatus Kapabacteria bacterium]|nr:hypothetical protein [Candidatus Kapabacteria bacterium]